MDDSSQDDFSDTLRVLVATDCHLGYMEKDEIRRHDSFQAFEEICSIAEQNQVDFILLGGDLFHENKPSRTTLVKTIEILRRYCLNDRPVQFQVVSDQTVNFANIFGHVNYEDPHYNVGLPVFTIHGNHDDPAGVVELQKVGISHGLSSASLEPGVSSATTSLSIKTRDNLSAVDILSACNLVNYFGKMALEGSGVGQITLHPILMRKGYTSVALYGLGNIRDERLNRMFQTPHAVQWIRPEVQELELSEWFNILVLHQNRVKSNPKNAISEQFLPRFLDFIVWGHEHESLADPKEAAGMGFHITQPGSSVATSLIEGESKEKHVLLLEIKGNHYRPTKLPLKSVRPFEYAEIVLKDEGDIDPNDQNSILEHLDTVVSNLIEQSSRKATNRKELKLPLVRVKVDYSGFMTINPQRFGQKYVGKVANPQDILIFSKSSKRGRTEGKIEDSEKLRPEELNQQNIEALVAESNLKMEILPVNDLDVALQNFVNKDDKMAFHSCLRYNLDETRKKIARDSNEAKLEEEDLIVKVGECLEERVKERATHPSDSEHLSALHSEDARAKGQLGAGSTVSFSDSDDTTQPSALKPTKRGQKNSSAASQRGKASTRGRGRGRGSSSMKQMTLDASLGFRQSERSASVAASASMRSLGDNVDSASSDEGEQQPVANDVADSSEDNERPQAKGRKRAAPRGRGRGLAASKRGRKTENSALQRLMSKDDDDDDEDDIPKRFTRSQPKAPKNYGALRR